MATPAICLKQNSIQKPGTRESAAARKRNRKITAVGKRAAATELRAASVRPPGLSVERQVWRLEEGFLAVQDVRHELVGDTAIAELVQLPRPVNRREPANLIRDERRHRT